MAVYYVGPGGNDGNPGTSWVLRRLTITAGLPLLTVNGDELVVGPGTYRELVTLPAGGAAGVPKLLTGDYLGRRTDGIGGPVRITGSDNDIVASRNYCISASARNFWAVSGFLFDLSIVHLVYLSGVTNVSIGRCVFDRNNRGQASLSIDGATQAFVTVGNCVFTGGAGYGVYFTHAVTVNDSGHVLRSNIFAGGGGYAVRVDRIGGITIQNCHFYAGWTRDVWVGAALAGGQIVTVNNCLLQGASAALYATVLGELIENYNAFFGNTTDRTNVAVGANSNTTPMLPDSRPWFEMMFEQRLVSPFDLASYSQLIDVAGVNPPVTDLRGTGTIGAQREWGALEYDPTLLTRRFFARDV